MAKYGTVAHVRVKPGMEQKLIEEFQTYNGLNIPGYLNSTLYRMDANANEYYMAVVFESKESYLANANDPAQDVRYRQMLELLDGEPEWHDGEIVYGA